MTTPLPAELLKLLTTDQTPSRTRLLQAAVSLVPTRHRVSTASGSELYTHCTPDTLLLPLVLNENAQVETGPPDASPPIFLRV